MFKVLNIMSPASTTNNLKRFHYNSLLKLLRAIFSFEEIKICIEIMLKRSYGTLNIVLLLRIESTRAIPKVPRMELLT